MEIRLKKKHVDFILSHESFSQTLRDMLLKEMGQQKDSVMLEISEDEVISAREIAEDLFLHEGLDEEQDPTPTGLLIEELIDMFCMPKHRDNCREGT